MNVDSLYLVKRLQIDFSLKTYISKIKRQIARMTTMSYPDLIAKKRDGEELTDNDIRQFVNGVTTESMVDSQIGAMLMAIYLKDLSTREVSTLTKEMVNSGSTLKWPEDWSGNLVDKHSTGGVGDKISLVLAPVLAAAGLKVPMISGRGLGHTGGTLDKLESIPGFKVSLSQEEMTIMLSQVGCFIAGSTNDITPADKRLYSIRDVTSTVSHNGLISASIVSKKAAESINALVLDVKTGRGAFMEEEEDALKLARSMVSCSKSLGIKTVALITEMDSPIGNMVGNALEVAETVKCLRGNGPDDLLDLVLDLGGHLLLTGGFADNLEQGLSRLRSTITDGSALSKFCDMLKGQGVPAAVADDICNPEINIWTSLTPSKSKTYFCCPNEGYVESIDAMDIAVATHKLGGGRNVPNEKINLAVGVQLLVDIGHKVEKGQAWVTVHHDSPISEEVKARLTHALVLTKTPVTPRGSRTRRVVLE